MTQPIQRVNARQVSRNLKALLLKRWRWAAVAAIALVVIGIVYALYWFPPSGFSRYDRFGQHEYRTLWDWMDLLIVPAMLAAGVFALNQAENKRTRARALDRSRESEWQAYLDHMSELLLEHGLGTRAEAKKIARARTLAVLRHLDGKRKGYLVQFLHDSELIEKQDPLVELDRADLSGIELGAAYMAGPNLKGAYLARADLGFAELHEADLSEATLNDANLRGAVLTKANLQECQLLKADLSGADLSGADLSNANLYRATVTEEQLGRAKTLEGATRPDGTRYTVP